MSTNLKSCVDHEEATIRSYMRDPKFADYMLQEAIAEGDTAEEQKIRRRINEAKSRKYWSEIVLNAEQTAKSGSNLEATVVVVSRALAILKSALPVKS